MAKIRRNGVPLAEFAGVKPYLRRADRPERGVPDRYGNERPARARGPGLGGGHQALPARPGHKTLVPRLAGPVDDRAEVQRRPRLAWSAAGDDAEEVFRQTYPSLHSHMKSLEEKLRKRQDKGRTGGNFGPARTTKFSNNRRSSTTDITWRLGNSPLPKNRRISVNKAYMWPTTDLWVLAVAQLTADLGLQLAQLAPREGRSSQAHLGSFTEKLPIAPPTDEARAEAEEAVGRLVAIHAGGAGVAAGRPGLAARRVRRREAGPEATGLRRAHRRRVRRGSPQAASQRRGAVLPRGSQAVANRVRRPRNARARSPHRSREAGAAPLEARQRSLRPHARRSRTALVHRPAPDAALLRMETADYFRRSVMGDPDRSDITVEMCERVVAAAEYTNQQNNGLWQIWGYVSEFDGYIRVITSADRQRLINAFRDRNFTRRV